jgi:capsular exopolysaccharide synthesis family protein
MRSVASEALGRGRAEVTGHPAHSTAMNAADIDQHLVTLVAPTSFAASRYRSLADLLGQSHPELRIIGVTSPGLGDGKTTTAINLAGAIARAGAPRTLLVSADLRRPSLTRLFRLEGRPGLSDLILDPRLTLDEIVVQYPAIGLSILPMGRCPDDPYRALQSMRENRLLRTLQERYPTVIVDTPPLLAVPDCGAIASEVDGFLLVVAAHRTSRELLEGALSTLDPAKVVGLVFNADDQASRSGRQYSAYYP